MPIPKYLLISIVILLGMSPADAGTFKALRDFAAVNPNGTWSYGYGATTRDFTLYGAFIHDCEGIVGLDCWEDAWPLKVGRNYTGATFVFSTALVANNALILHTGASLERTIVRWTCPRSGTYELSGFFEILDESPTGVRAKILVDGKNVTIAAFGDSGELIGPGADLTNLKPGQRKNFAFTGFVKKGHIIIFGLSPNGNFSNDTTGFNAVITRVSP